jgi:hypothetical protein
LIGIKGGKAARSETQLGKKVVAKLKAKVAAKKAAIRKT